MSDVLYFAVTWQESVKRKAKQLDSKMLEARQERKHLTEMEAKLYEIHQQ